jgi:putative oxidoreductase
MNDNKKPTSSTGLLCLARCAIKLLERVPAALPVFLLRLPVAYAFFQSGLTKLPLGNPATTGLFADIYKVPLLPPSLAAYLGTIVEIAAPIMLALGLGARVGAALLIGQTLVIGLFVFPDYWLTEYVFWLTPLIYVLLRGPGKWSIDALLRDRFGGGP